MTEEIERVSASGIPLLVFIPDQPPRVAVAFFASKSGGIFFDIGWCDGINPGHPAHLLTGKLKALPSGKEWTLGRATISEMDENDPEWREWADWQAASREMTGCAIEQARQAASEAFPGEID